MLINGQTFYEDSQQPRSPEFAFAGDNARVQLSLLSRGADDAQLFASAKALVGYNVVETDDNGAGGSKRRWISRGLPYAYPAVVDEQLNPNATPYLFARSIPRVEMLGVTRIMDVNDRPEYPANRWTVACEAVPFYVRPDAQVLNLGGTGLGLPPRRPDEGYALSQGWASDSRYVSKIVRPAPRVYTLPQGFMQYNASFDGSVKKQPIPVGLPFPQYREEIVYTWWDVPVAGIPFNAMGNLAGCTNNDVFDGYPGGTLLYISSEVRPRQGPLGDRLCTVMHKLIYQPNAYFFAGSSTQLGHNFFPRVLSGTFGYWAVSSDGAFGSNNVPFPYADLTALFRPDQG